MLAGVSMNAAIFKPNYFQHTPKMTSRLSGELHFTLYRKVITCSPSRNMTHDNQDSDNDALIETHLRIAQLRAEVEMAADGPVAFGHPEDCPLDVVEKFWKHVHSIETAVPMPVKEALLKRTGFEPEPLENLQTDQQVHDALWALLRALASMRTFFEGTDHLSDRELYAVLLEEVLPGPTELMPEDSEWNERFDLSEFSGDPPAYDPNVFLQYYADDMMRDFHVAECPDEPLPPKKELPYDRDQHLPKET